MFWLVLVLQNLIFNMEERKIKEKSASKLSKYTVCFPKNVQINFLFTFMFLEWISIFSYVGRAFMLQLAFCFHEPPMNTIVSLWKEKLFIFLKQTVLKSIVTRNHLEKQIKWRKILQCSVMFYSLIIGDSYLIIALDFYSQYGYTEWKVLECCR